MKYKKIPFKINEGEMVTSLYHSPFDFNLLYMICLGKTGLRLKVILDDIDNIGIDRANKQSGYCFAEKYFLSKTERTNIRPLSLITPKNMFANLALPNIKECDNKFGIKKIMEEQKYNGTIEHWIQDITNGFGIFTLIGPDKAFSTQLLDESFICAIQQATNHINGILSRFPEKSESAIKFINWLFDEKIKTGTTISDYYYQILVKIVNRFQLSNSISLGRMSDFDAQNSNKSLLNEFNKNKSLQDIYLEALHIDGKKELSDFPFYAISKKIGERLLPIEKYLNNPEDYFIAPKVLMLNNHKNLVLPIHAIDKTNIYARELMYKEKTINCNQIFCDDKWFNWISSFNLKVNLNEKEASIYGRHEIDLALLRRLALGQEKANGPYEQWIIESTFRGFDQAKYPLIFLALFQDDIFYKNIPDFYKLIIE